MAQNITVTLSCSFFSVLVSCFPRSTRSGRFFTVKLPVALDPGAKISVIVEAVYTHVLQPYPTQITQSEKQFVVFEGNHYFYSPYPTKTQTMRVKLASRNVESYTKLGNPTRSEDLLDYGPFLDIPAYSQVGPCSTCLLWSPRGTARGEAWVGIQGLCRINPRISAC